MIERGELGIAAALCARLGDRLGRSAVRRPLADAGARHERADQVRQLHRRPRRMTASASTAGSSATCPTSASARSRAGRAPASSASTASAPRPATGSRPGQSIRVPPQGEERAAAEDAAPKRADAERRRDRLRPRAGDPRGRGRDRRQQAARPRHPGRHQDQRPSRPAARRPRRRGRAAAQAGPPARQGHVGRAAGRPHAARRRLLLEELFRPHRAQGLLGAGRRRARRSRTA